MRSLVTVFGLVVVGLACLAQTGAAAPPPEPDGQIRFEQIIASVFDADGKPTPGLRAREFVVEEGGKKSTIVGFNVGSDVPLSLIIMIDTNGEMAPMLPNAMAAVQPLLALLGPRDEYAIYAFDSDIRPVLPFSPIRAADVPKVTAAVKALKAKGQTTALYNIVADGAAKMKEAKYTRRALVVITNAKDREAGNVAAIKRASSANNVAIYAVGLTGTVKKPGEDEGPKKMTLAEAAIQNIGVNAINRSTSLTDLGLTDVAAGLQSSGAAGFGGMGGGGGGFPGMGGGGRMGGGGGGNFSGYNSPFGGGSNVNMAQYGCNSQNSGFSSNSNFGGNFAVLQNQTNLGGNDKFNDRFNQTAFNRNQVDTKSVCANSNNNGSFGNLFGGPGGSGPDGVMSVRSSQMLDAMVKNGGGRGILLDFSAFATDMGAQQTVQRIINLGQDISQDLRGQYTLGYYTTGAEPIDKRITVKLSFDKFRAEENERFEALLEQNKADEAATKKIKESRAKLPEEANFKVVLQTKVVTVATPEKSSEKSEKTSDKNQKATPQKK